MTADPTPLDPAGLAGAWSLDPARTSITIRTKAMWLLPVKGTAKAVEGGGTVGPDGSVSGTLVVDAASIDTGTAKRDQHLRDADFFEVAKYPTITYEATTGTVSASGRVELTGTLTLHGRTQQLALVGRVTAADDDGATVVVEAEVDRSQWGMTFSKMGAGLRNHLVISARFTKA
ncbi:YceI family protein [Streptomyces sp. NBC_00963]|uniref:YceI family protein n=1 Tax=Streptomyces sp. NBC_00963 TaxID=2903697 RepID=UPI003870E5D2|nr:YceI family protein [Streptomyces sp. NBC_00963]